MPVVVESVPKLLLTQREAADALGVSERTLFSLTSPRGPIPAVRMGKSVRYSLAALQAWIGEQTK
ncbi:MAG TPA: helix-turn-helix domain-containing protein [Pirellulaceae bacterium]|nr:helix-turn-helix domain-containing protein [Pirellulaceae bacterium]